jgi:hypothetical protein
LRKEGSAHGHLGEQIKVEGDLSDEEREAAILDATSLKLEITASRKRRQNYRKIIWQPMWKSL